MSILITGGTGLIGTQLANCFANQTQKVFILTRSKHISSTPLIEYIQYENGKIPSSIQNVKVLINLAGAGIADKAWTKSYKQLLKDSRIQTTRACVEFIQQLETKPDVFISASAVGYYGTKNSQLLDEASPAGNDFLAKLAIEWEAEAMKAPIRTVLLRTGIVLSMDGGAFPKIIPPFKFYAGGYIGTGKQGFPWIHVQDAVGLILWAIQNTTLHGPLNLVAPETLNNAQFAKILGKILHKPVAFPIPTFIIKSLLGERAMLLLEGQKVYPQKAIDGGYTFAFPTAEKALKNLLVPEHNLAK